MSWFRTQIKKRKEPLKKTREVSPEMIEILRKAEEEEFLKELKEYQNASNIKRAKGETGR